ncbi:MAG: hypothetical protein EON58_00355 [Alphaproteobacteria bacterium]|nr:MAG: hypothetical protein EON58_00355 [Alphaproteobacteria bacterium]
MTENKETIQALSLVAKCTNPDDLKRLYVNATKLGNKVVADAAQRKRFAVLPAAEPGTVEHDVWQSIHALEAALSDERGKTTRLARTRQKISRDGEIVTVRDLIMKSAASEGFKMLMERGWPELAFESVALRHPDQFAPEILKKAEDRLSDGARD